jgi:Arc/MetJ-type ribon-helix-helix transcriptional regulator
MDDETPLMSIRVDEETREVWDSYIEDSGEVANRSELIRRGVSYYMNRDQEQDVQLIDVLEELKEMRKNLQIAKQSIENVESRQLTFEDVMAASEEADSGEIQKIENKITDLQENLGGD